MTEPVSEYRYSFSGADARAFTWLDEAPANVKPLETLHTISISVHEAKSQVRSLGYRGVRGLARGVRTIAGSLILTVINDHPLWTVQEQVYDLRNQLQADFKLPGWSADREMIGVGSMSNNLALSRMMPTLLPPFNISLYYVSEMTSISPFGGANKVGKFDHHSAEGAGLLIRGIEFIDDGMVTSVNDIVSEVTLSFLAFDYKPISRITPEETQEGRIASVNYQDELVRRLAGG